MSNQDIRHTATEAGVKLWQIADALGMADCSFFPETPQGTAPG